MKLSYAGSNLSSMWCLIFIMRCVCIIDIIRIITINYSLIVFSTLIRNSAVKHLLSCHATYFIIMVILFFYDITCLLLHFVLGIGKQLKVHMNQEKMWFCRSKVNIQDHSKIKRYQSLENSLGFIWKL